jgi:hypothetical protein
MGLTGQISCQFAPNWLLAHSAKNLAKSGGFLSRKRKVVVFGKFHKDETWQELLHDEYYEYLQGIHDPSGRQCCYILEVVCHLEGFISLENLRGNCEGYMSF